MVGLPVEDGGSQVPQVPSAHDDSTPTPASSTTSSTSASRLATSRVKTATEAELHLLPPALYARGTSASPP